ncbi:MAG: efflux RND transporter permease subunit, partial [Waddliaceae bacterium]
MISRFFIDRPIFASVIAIIIMIAGGVAMVNLPIAQYPEITPPQIQVTAVYPGANAETVSENVASPIEQQVNGSDDMLYMYSTSSSTGNLTLNVFFDISRDPDLAQVDVQNRLNLALPQLPQVVTQQGVTVKKVSSTFLMIIAIYSPEGRYDSTYVGNYANLYVLDAIKRIPGANQSSILGSPDYAMRLWVKPDRMAQLKITAQDIVRAVKEQNEEFAVGRVGQEPTDESVILTFPVATKGRLTTPDEFENIILRTDSSGAAIVKLKDVGRAELGAKDYSVQTYLNGKNATLIAVYQQPGSNALSVSTQVTALLEEMKQSFPDGIDYKISMDTTKFVRASIREVITTFFIACVLVILVVLVFLGTIRATIIPVIAIPVSIIGTFIGMMLFGFSINMLTLFGLILAIGLVVDDAIVVMENVERNMSTLKLPPKEAAKRAMDEVTGPIIATTLVVLAVFIPVTFLGGITGALYKQFAMTIAISVFISSIVALTLSPALTAIMLKPDRHKGKFFVWFDTKFDQVVQSYATAVQYVLNHIFLFLLAFAATILAVFIFFKVVPTSFVPQEDQGYLFGVYMLPDSSSLQRTSKVGEKVDEIFMRDPAVSDVARADGYSLLDSQLKTNAGTLFVALKNYDERTETSLQAPAIVARTGAQMAGINEAVAFPINPPAIPGLGTVGGFEFWVENRGDASYLEVGEVVNALIAKSKDVPALSSLSTTINPLSEQLMIHLDREKAEVLGIPIQEVFNSLQTLFGSIYVSQFTKFSRLFQVIVQAEASYRMKPDDIDQVYVRNREGTMVPLSSVLTMSWVPGPDLIARFNGFPAAKITGSPAEGYSS